MQLTMTVSLGDVLQGVAAVGTLMALYFKLSERMIILETKVTDLWDRRSGPRH